MSDLPKLCFFLTMTSPQYGGDNAGRPPAKYRLIVDPNGTPRFEIEIESEDRLGGKYWKLQAANELNRGIYNELASRAMVALSSQVGERRVVNGVVCFDLGEQSWDEDV